MYYCNCLSFPILTIEKIFIMVTHGYCVLKSIVCLIKIIRFQEKNWNQNRDSNLGPPDLQPGTLPLEIL